MDTSMSFYHFGRDATTVFSAAASRVTPTRDGGDAQSRNDSGCSIRVSPEEAGWSGHPNQYRLLPRPF
jgi:hypothetical protein